MSPFSAPIASVPQLDDQLTVAAARSALSAASQATSQAAGRPAIVLDRVGHPRGLLFPHRLLAPHLLADQRLSGLTALLVEVPLVEASTTRETLADWARVLLPLAGGYVIAIAADGLAIGVIDVAALGVQTPDESAIAAIAAHVTHAVASPLMGITSLVTLLEDRRSPPLALPQAAQVRAISRSATRITAELERLDWALRLHQGQATMYPERLELASLYRELLDQLSLEPPESPNLSELPEPPEVKAFGSIAVWLDRRYGLHLLRAAIACAGRTIAGMPSGMQWGVQAIGRDLRLSLRNSVTTPPDDRAARHWLTMLVQAIGGDVSVKPYDPGHGLDLLLPGIVLADRADRVESPPASAPNPPQNLPPDTPDETDETTAITFQRAIVLTQRLSGQDLEQLEPSGWYLAIARSLGELLEKVTQLSPELVLLDCGNNGVHQRLDRRLLPYIGQQLSGITIAAIASPAEAEAIAALPKPPQILRYPLETTEVSHCFQQVGATRSTMIWVDLRQPCQPRQSAARDARDRPPDIQTAQDTESHNTVPITAQLSHYRTIEVGDLAQARLFAEIWQPQAIVLQFSTHTSGSDWPEAIAQFAETVRAPCLVVEFSGWWGQACRRDRSLVYWPTTEPDIGAALHWLQS